MRQSRKLPLSQCAKVMALLLLSVGSAQAAPPSGLLGRSVIMSWSESLTVRTVGDSVSRSFTQTVTLTMYVSTAGRVFWRQRRSTHGRGDGTGRASVGTSQAAPGDALPHDMNMRRTQFSGDRMMYSEQYRSGARQIVVNFGGGFANCSATVMHGRESGSTERLRSSVTRELIDIEAVKTGSVECSVREGPAF
jgi:hypothetical protein